MYNTMLISSKNNVNWFTIKTLVFPVLILIICLSSGEQLYSQSITKQVAFDEESVQPYKVKQFTGKCVNEIIYFKFLVMENRKDIQAYILETSFDAINFMSVAFKDGFESPNNVPLLYCFKQPKSLIYKTYYRIKMVTKSGITYSNIIEHRSNSPILYSMRN